MHELDKLDYFAALSPDKQRKSIASSLIKNEEEGLSGVIDDDTLERVIAHDRPLSVVNALIDVRSQLELEQNYINLVSHPSVREPKTMARVLKRLNTAGLLNPENIALIQSCVEMEDSIILSELIAGIDFLKRYHLLNQENFARLCSEEHRYALQDEIWSVIRFNMRFIEGVNPDVAQTDLLDAIFAGIVEDDANILDEETLVHHVVGIPHPGAAAGAVQPQINPGQSTHTASVHESVSASAQRLADKYAIVNLPAILAEIEVFINRLNDDDIKHLAAKRCFARMMLPNFSVGNDPETGNPVAFTDPVSRLTILQLLALTYVAIQDGASRTGELQDAEKLFVEGLYEIQRGYNISASGVDDGEDDYPICIPGTFNKLIEKLGGVHPDAEIIYVTQDTFNTKFAIVFKEQALAYLHRIANASSAEDYLAARALINQIKEEEIYPISKIESKVRTAITNEFSGLMPATQLESYINSCMIGAPYLAPLAGVLDGFLDNLEHSPGKLLHDEAAAATAAHGQAGATASAADLGLLGGGGPRDKPEDKSPAPASPKSR